eukprot:15450308-Alexandrium_andersonii.AAC.1
MPGVQPPGPLGRRHASPPSRPVAPQARGSRQGNNGSGGCLTSLRRAVQVIPATAAKPIPRCTRMPSQTCPRTWAPHCAGCSPTTTVSPSAPVSHAGPTDNCKTCPKAGHQHCQVGAQDAWHR